MQDDNVPDYGLPVRVRQPPDVSTATTATDSPNKDFEETDVYIVTLRLDHAFNDDITHAQHAALALYKRDHEVTVRPASWAPRRPGTPLATIMVSRGRRRARAARTRSSPTRPTSILKFDTCSHEAHARHRASSSRWETPCVQRYDVHRVPNTSHATSITPTLPRPPTWTRTTNFRGDDRRVHVRACTRSTRSRSPAVAEDHGRPALRPLRRRLREQVPDARSSAASTTVVSPRAALVVPADPAQTYYFSYGTSFNPSAEALTLAVNTVNTEPEKNTHASRWAPSGISSTSRLRPATAPSSSIDKTNARTTDPAARASRCSRASSACGASRSRATGTILPRLEHLRRLHLPRHRGHRVAATWRSGIPVEGKRLPNVARAHVHPVDDVRHHRPVAGGRRRVLRRAALREQHQHDQRRPGYVRGDLTAAYRPIKPTRAARERPERRRRAYFDQVHPGPRGARRRPHVPASPAP